MNLKKNATGRVLLLALVMLLPVSVLADAATDRASELNAQWDAAFNRGDAEAVAAFYAEDAVLSPGNGEVVQGREAIRDLFQSFIDNGVHSHAIEVVEAHLSGDVLYQVAEWQAQGENAEGDPIAFGGILSNTFRRNADGTWRSHQHVWNMAD